MLAPSSLLSPCRVVPDSNVTITRCGSGATGSLNGSATAGLAFFASSFKLQRFSATLHPQLWRIESERETGGETKYRIDSVLSTQYAASVRGKVSKEVRTNCFQLGEAARATQKSPAARRFSVAVRGKWARQPRKKRLGPAGAAVPRNLETATGLGVAAV